MAIILQSRKTILFCLLGLAWGVGIFLWLYVSAQRDVAERESLFARFDVISDPFARPKIYRHKSANNFNPAMGAKHEHGEISLVTTSEGQVVFLILQEKLRWSPTAPILGIKILVNDEIFDLRLSPCLFMPDDKFKYHSPPKVISPTQSRENLTMAKLAEAIESDKSEAPYLYRVMDREDEQTLNADQLKAFKETFRLASLLRR